MDLSGYSTDLKGETFQVWVDPPRSLRQEYDELLLKVQQDEIRRVTSELTPDPGSDKSQSGVFASVIKRAQALLNLRERNVQRAEGTDICILKWYVNIWSQGANPITLEECQRIEDENPAFLGWLITETWRMIHENQVRQKKN